MRGLRTVFAAAGVSLALASGGAQAADMGDPFLEPLLPVEIGSSWYLRGDIGYHMNTTPSAQFTRLDGRTEQYKNVSLGDSMTIGGGAGYKFNPWFRADATIDYAGTAGFDGKLFCNGASCGSQYLKATGSISSWTLLANGYFDLGTWAGFTPYVGGGIGATSLALKDYIHVNLPRSNPRYTRRATDERRWNFAWAVTAGASYDVTPNTLIDMNYRYLSLGDAQAKDTNGRVIDVEGVDAHEFRIGFRYLID